MVDLEAMLTQAEAKCCSNESKFVRCDFTNHAGSQLCAACRVNVVFRNLKDYAAIKEPL
jgi:hypothetical protein